MAEVRLFVKDGEFAKERAIDIAQAMYGPGYTFEVVRVEEPAAWRELPLRVTIEVTPTVKER